MKIGVVGCSHGELNKIYEVITYIQNRENIKLDLLICCGDFQSFRDISDMKTMAAPEKYQEMKDFHEYYSEKKFAPVLTLFIGGNHESANYLWELPYGGWVAQNIYYMGFAGVINFGGLRIGGLSGIYKSHDYHKGHFEKPPFNEQTKRSFYHVRSYDVAKLKLLREKEIDIFLTHDWPREIYHHGNVKQLIKFKPFLRDEIEKDILGSVPAQDLLHKIMPKYWFSGHMHAKFAAIVEHINADAETKFLALSKCLPQKDFLQIVDIESNSEDEKVLKFDPEWVCILQNSNNIYSSSSKTTFLTELDENCKPSHFEIENFLSSYEDLNVFPYSKSVNGINEQTKQFCEKFDLHNPCVVSQHSIISNNSHGSSQKTFHSKLNIPQPSRTPVVKKLTLTPPVNSNSSINSDDFDDAKNPNSFSQGHGDDFDDLVNPNSLNQDEINLSESGSSDSESNSSKSDGEEAKSVDSGIHQYSSNMSTIESPRSLNTSSMIESLHSKTYQSTPYKRSESGSLLKSSIANSLIVSDSTESESPEKSSSTIVSDEHAANITPVQKKFKIMRRNQQVYSTPRDDSD